MSYPRSHAEAFCPTLEDAETTDLRQRLAASELGTERQAMLFDLGLFHRREVKPALPPEALLYREADGSRGT